MKKENAAGSNEGEVVFLGLCDRVAQIWDRNIYNWNILGLRTILVSCLYPFNLDSWHIALAFRGELAGKEFTLSLKDGKGYEVGSLSISATLDDSDAENQSVEKVFQSLGFPESAWVPYFFSLKDKGWLVKEPGEVLVECVYSNSRRKIIGEVIFGSFDVIPLSIEKKKALKSDPHSRKMVIYELGCKKCPTKYKVYTSIERDSEIEEKGCIWYEDVADKFDCSCGNTKMNLKYIRRNLHILLEANSNNFEFSDFIPLYEKSALYEVNKKYKKLISSEPREESLQIFLNENPILLHQYPAEKIIVKPPILNKYKADYAILTPKKQLVFIEIEKTTTRLLKKNGGTHSELTHAIDQVEEWLHVFDEHKLAILDDLGIERESVSSVLGVVIAGRDIGYDALQLRKIKGRDFGRVEFLTFDDLYFALESLIGNFGRL